ncbi:DNA-processing protein DprA [Oerskovia flava]|uniref:DNA-processing protein DprA n=1 Tax=Oerskovia flava TaxID=2986422 RepID=UPI00223F1073|nr:DNA-processing protein DprA [Oerskovia sp. JB1-3-2]
MPEPRRTPLPFDVSDPLLAHAAWSRIVEPGDEVAGALLAHLGAVDALAWMLDAVRQPRPAAAELAGSGRAVAALSAPSGGPPPDRRAAARLARSLARWAPRLDGLDPRRELRVLERLGGRAVLPTDDDWPAGLDDLGASAPVCLWVRGESALDRLASRSVALVGARACTDYGAQVATELAAGLADRGFTVVSGGAYGIDAAVHRGALAAGGSTVAFLAGGVDRLYPAGNTDLLRAMTERGGAVVSEVPPGSVPSRVRFLQRNRLIAAFTRSTVVVEAAWRSGSLSTAARAAALLRPVGAVPGPVTSMASGGCHRLLRDAAAVCVTDVAEVAELAGDLGDDATPARVALHAVQDDLDDLGTRLWDALPVRSTARAESVARAAGVSVPEALGGLGNLELLGLAESVADGWRRARPPVR